MDRKIIVILTLIIAGVLMSLNSSFMGLYEQISTLTNENAEIQDGLTTLPFVQIGRNFLDGLNKTTGKILSIQLEEKAPNFYWHNSTEADKLGLECLRLCWIIRFEQVQRPGHFFEVWVDTDRSQVVGGGQCR